MQKIIKKYGSSLIITISPEEQKVFDLKKGDIIELTITGIKNGPEHSTQD